MYRELSNSKRFMQILAGLHEHVPTLPHVEGSVGISSMADVCSRMCDLEVLVRHHQLTAYCPAPALAVRNVVARQQHVKLSWPKATFEA